MAKSAYQDLKDTLTDLAKVLDTPEYAAIADAISKPAKVFPVIVEVIEKLIALLKVLKQELIDLDVTGIPGLAKVTEVTVAAAAVANAAKLLLADSKKQGAQDVLDVLSQVAGFPDLETLKKDIIPLIEGIIEKLDGLKPK
jgi:hypothetical protein